MRILRRVRESFLAIPKRKRVGILMITLSVFAILASQIATQHWEKEVCRFENLEAVNQVYLLAQEPFEEGKLPEGIEGGLNLLGEIYAGLAQCPDPQLSARAFFNLGNLARFKAIYHLVVYSEYKDPEQQKLFSESLQIALESYEQSLLRDSTLHEAKRNYELLQSLAQAMGQGEKPGQQGQGEGPGGSDI